MIELDLYQQKILRDKRRDFVEELKHYKLERAKPSSPPLLGDKDNKEDNLQKRMIEGFDEVMEVARYFPFDPDKITEETGRNKDGLEASTTARTRGYYRRAMTGVEVIQSLAAAPELVEYAKKNTLNPDDYEKEAFRLAEGLSGSIIIHAIHAAIALGLVADRYLGYIDQIGMPQFLADMQYIKPKSMERQALSSL